MRARDAPRCCTLFVAVVRRAVYEPLCSLRGTMPPRASRAPQTAAARCVSARRAAAGGTCLPVASLHSMQAGALRYSFYLLRHCRAAATDFFTVQRPSALLAQRTDATACVVTIPATAITCHGHTLAIATDLCRAFCAQPLSAYALVVRNVQHTRAYDNIPYRLPSTYYAPPRLFAGAAATMADTISCLPLVPPAFSCKRGVEHTALPAYNCCARPAVKQRQLLPAGLA